MPSELTVADIQQAFFEYQASFKEPIVGFWFDKGFRDVVTAMHKALSSFNVGLENITWNQTPKNAREIHLEFSVPTLFANVQISLWGIYMSAINVGWSRAPELTSLFQTALDTCKEVIRHELQSQQTTLGFHVKPGVKPFREILGQLVNVKMLGRENATMFGVSAYSPEFSTVIDASMVFPEGLFIKLIRVFPAAALVQEMAGTLYKDEEATLRSIGLKLQ